VIAPPLIVWVERRYGWQATFLALGASGFVWLALWLVFYRDPAPVAKRSAALPWSVLLRHREVWAIVLARFFADPVWWLYITWLPLYLYEVHGFSLQQIGAFAWLPYVAADAGSLGGGWMSGHLIARGWTVDRARKGVILFGMLCMCAGLFAAASASAAVALAVIAAVLFGFQSWINNVQTLPSDYFPENAVGAVTGLGGTGAGVGAILFTQATGFVVDHFHSYTPVLVTAGLLPVLGTAALFILGGPVRRITFERYVS
jgi:ACS family hexuronate transporter-like MFS transporter